MDVEKAFLGSIIKANYLLSETIIRPEHLQDTRNQNLYKEFINLHREGKSIDLLSLSMLPNLESYGGVSYFSFLESNANVEKFESIQELILEKWKDREKKNILVRATNEDWGINKIQKELDNINETKINDYQPLSDLLQEVYEVPWQEKAVQKGAPTGLKKLDTMTNGFQTGEVTIIAARPSMGKTDVMLHFSKQVGWSGYIPIIYSLEMPGKALTTRLIASTGGFNRTKMRDPYHGLTPEQKNHWVEIIGVLSKTNIQIFDGAGQTVSEMRSKVRQVMNQFPGKKPVIFIDYLTLIRPSQFYGGNAHQQVTEISKDLKQMAKDFDCPVVCLAQLNRSVESRQDKRPMMSDIRESGSVEQDADVIIFLYRDKYYNRESDDDTLELIIAKNRNGPVGTVKAKYNHHTGVIEDADFSGRNVS